MRAVAAFLAACLTKLCRRPEEALDLAPEGLIDDHGLGPHMHLGYAREVVQIRRRGKDLGLDLRAHLAADVRGGLHVPHGSGGVVLAVTVGGSGGTVELRRLRGEDDDRPAL